MPREPQVERSTLTLYRELFLMYSVPAALDRNRIIHLVSILSAEQIYAHCRKKALEEIKAGFDAVPADQLGNLRLLVEKFLRIRRKQSPLERQDEDPEAILLGLLGKKAPAPAGAPMPAWETVSPGRSRPAQDDDADGDTGGDA